MVYPATIPAEPQPLAEVFFILLIVFLVMLTFPVFNPRNIPFVLTPAAPPALVSPEIVFPVTVRLAVGWDDVRMIPVGADPATAQANVEIVLFDTVELMLLDANQMP